MELGLDLDLDLDSDLDLDLDLELDPNSGFQFQFSIRRKCSDFSSLKKLKNRMLKSHPTTGCCGDTYADLGYRGRFVEENKSHLRVQANTSRQPPKRQTPKG